MQSISVTRRGRQQLYKKQVSGKIVRSVSVATMAGYQDLRDFEYGVIGGALQWGSYGRISRIIDTRPPSYRDLNMCNYNPTNRVPYLKKGPEGNLIQGLFRASYASGLVLTGSVRIATKTSNKVTRTIPERESLFPNFNTTPL
ncbi:hypothetical protein TNCV_1696311 [Trichonephila clavipes]|nr:hypothetical protein TNCV_1696311 [Trichonephila clavipes]